MGVLPVPQQDGDERRPETSRVDVGSPSGERPANPSAVIGNICSIVGQDAACGRRTSTVMADKSAIEWTEATWNPVTGCDKVSPGCAHCYAETFAERWRGIPGHPYEQGFALKLWPQRLEQPLKWSRPRMIFVNSMSDLFHEGIPDAYLEQVFEVMGQARSGGLQWPRRGGLKWLHFASVVVCS